MNKKKLRIVLAVAILFIIIFAGVFFYASSVLKPEEIKKMALSALQETFPKAEVTLESLDVSVGLTSKINFTNLNIKLKKKSKHQNLIKVESFLLKVPFWSILTSSGAIDVEINAPQVNYAVVSKANNNWALAMGEKQIGQKIKKKESKNANAESKKTDLLLPSFVLGAQIDFAINNLKLDYFMDPKQKGSILVERVLLKDFSLTDITAFEVASHYELQLGEVKKKTVFDLLLIGQLNLEKFVTEREVGTNFILTIKKLSTPLSPLKVSSVKLEGDMLLDKSESIKGSLHLSAGEILSLKTKLSKSSKKINLSDMNLNVDLSNTLSSFKDLPTSATSMLGINDSHLVLTGGVDFYPERSVIVPSLEVKTTKAIDVNLDKLSVSNELAGSFNSKVYDLSVNSRMMKGALKVAVKGKMPRLKIDQINPKSFFPVSIDVMGGSMKITKDFLKGMMASNNESPGKTKGNAQKDVAKTAGPMIPLIPMGVKLDIRQVDFAGEELTINGNIKGTEKSLSSQKISIGLGKSNSVVKFSLYTKNESASVNFSFDGNKIPMSIASVFLPKNIEEVTGTLSTKNSGDLDLRKQGGMSYNIKHSSTITDGELKGIDFNSYLKGFIENLDIPGVKKAPKVGKVDISNKFDKLESQLGLTEKMIDVKKVDFKGIDGKLLFDANGKISMENKPSVLYVNAKYLKSSVDDFMKKSFNDSVIPLKLVGNGFGLSPNYGYTIEKLGKKYLKQKGKGEVKKLLKNKKVKKLLDKTKLKPEKLLKGLFN